MLPFIACGLCGHCASEERAGHCFFPAVVLVHSRDGRQGSSVPCLQQVLWGLGTLLLWKCSAGMDSRAPLLGLHSAWWGGTGMWLFHTVCLGWAKWIKRGSVLSGCPFPSPLAGEKRSQLGLICPTGDIRQCLKTFFCCHKWEVIIGIQWVEIRDAAKYATVHRIA